MKRINWVAARRSARTGACLLAVAAAGSAAFPQQTLAAVVENYVIFEIAASADSKAVADNLRMSLGNCLQIVVGQHARDVFVHIACDEGGQDSKYFEKAFSDLSHIPGIARATVVTVKPSTN